MTIAHQWAWKPDDVVKTTEQCLHSLVRSAGGDGNLLFNVGPMPDGRIEPLQVERLKDMGQWLKTNGYTIYGTRGGPFMPADWGVSTRKGNTVFLHILNWPGGSPRIVLPDIGAEIKKCSVVGGGPATFVSENGETVIEFDEALIQPMNTIIEIELAGSAMDIPPAKVRPASLSYMKPVSGSSNLKPHWSHHQWVDVLSVTNGDWVGDFWHPAEGDEVPWVEIDLGKEENISTAVLYEREENIRSFELQYKSGDEWKTLHSGTTIGSKAVVLFPEVSSRYIRLVIQEYIGTPGIYEIVLL
jgi:alpha-L-fucosidase